MTNNSITPEPDTRAREVAANALQSIYERGLPLDTALNEDDTIKSLSARDRAFTRLLCATTLRRTGQIDLVLKPFLQKKPLGFAYAVLRMGVAQILFLGTPAHASVHTSVELVKMRKKTKGYSPLVNAVLRKVIKQGAKIRATTRPMDNIPGWLKESWLRSYGPASVRRFAQVLCQDPPLDIQLKNTERRSLNNWAEKLNAEILPDKTLRLSKTAPVERLDGYESGEWWVQDTAASLAVKCLGDFEGKTALDMCAAPGGKTMQLCANGAKVTALDKSRSRLARVGRNLERVGLQAELIHTDATSWNAQNTFDIVILDAPCSATGTFRRHPDVIHNKSQRHVKSLVATQKLLLNEAIRRVNSGGTLIYCTCSLETREGEEQISKFMKNRPEFRLNSSLDLTSIGAEGAQTREGYLRLTPDMMLQKGGMDGFFIAVFTRC